MNKKNRIELPKERLEQFCRNYHIRKLSLFGSVLRDDFKASSDIDLLVEFETGFKVGLLKMARIENELSEVLGRKLICESRRLESIFQRKCWKAQR